MMLSDADLVLTVARAMYPNEPPVDIAELGPYHGGMCQRIARAIRAALTEPVTLLAPGETVMIPTVNGMDTGGIRIMGNPRLLALSLESSDGWWDGRFLDAAGVQALIDAARRWQAAQEAGE